MGVLVKKVVKFYMFFGVVFVVLSLVVTADVEESLTHLLSLNKFS